MTMSMREANRGLSVLDAITSRRAIRAYAPDPIDDATIEALLEAAVQAPTAMHGEPWRFVIVRDHARLARISDRAKALVMAEPGIGTYYGGILRDPHFNVFYDASTLIIICGATKGAFVTADCWLAAENLMLAATAYGLGTCVIGFAVRALAEPAIRAELGIPPEVVAVAPIIVGVPATMPAPTWRKPPEILAWR